MVCALFTLFKKNEKNQFEAKGFELLSYLLKKKTHC